jgi:predicted esterase
MPGPLLAAVLGGLQVLASMAAGAPAAGDPRDEAFLRRLFAAEIDPAGPKAAQLIRAYLAEGGHDANSLGKLLATDAAYEPMPPGWNRGTVQVSDGAKKYDVSFALRVPRSYRPDRPHALLLAAHGQGSSGQHAARTLLRMLGPEAEKYIILAPTMPGPSLFSGKAYQEQAFLGPLAWARRRLNVDDDRVCLAGYSMGGHCAWHLAVLFGRQFAAGVAMAGTPWFEGFPHTANLYLENLSNLPFWAIWGERDRPAPPGLGQVDFCLAATRRLKELGNAHYRGTELPGVGHEECWPSGQAFAAFLAGGRRQAAPQKLAHFFHLAHHRRGYYLEALELAGEPMRMDRPIRIKFARSPNDPQGDRAAEDYFRRFFFRMWAELDRRKNELAVRTSRIRGVRIYVTEGLFDLSRPVTLRFGGRTWRGKVNASPECMLRHYAAERDASAPVYNEIDLPYTGRTPVRYP